MANNAPVTPHQTGSASALAGGAPARPWLLTLDEIEGRALPLVGGKAFRLALLKQQGFHVPPGLVLTTHFFETHLKHARLVPLWAGTPDIAVTAEALNWLADTLKLKPFIREMAEAFQARLEATFSPEISSFAVRSSVIDEDQHDHTFAGIHLTELSVPRSVLPIAITRCWASALSEPAVKYRQRHGMSIQGIQIAVLIQPMLSPQSSGVGFTLNPLTGTRDELVIEAVWGLGQALVSGEIQPYFYRLSNQPPDYPLLEQRPGTAPPPQNGAPEDPLSPPEITSLARQLGQIQALMGDAQDVEWARQDQTFFILQSRPITARPEPPPATNQEWARSYQTGTLPELPSPLFSSLLERSQGELMRYLKDLGLKVDKLGPMQKIILGRPYLNLTLLRRILAQIGVDPDSFLQIVGYALPQTPPRLLSIDWKTAWQTRQIYRTALKHLLTPDYYLKKLRLLLAEATPATDPAPDDNLRRLNGLGKIFTMFETADLALLINIAGVTGLGARLVAAEARQPHILVKSLALHEVETEASHFHRAIADLATCCTVEDRDYLLRTDLNAQAQKARFSKTFSQELQKLLECYGHWAPYDADPAQPRYQEDPTPLLNLVKHALAEDKTASTGLEAPEIRSPWRRWLLTPLIKRLHRLFLQREALADLKARATTLCRHWSLVLGEEWAAAGWLETAEDIFWLTWAEIERTLIARSGVAITLSSTVKARKETYQSYSQIQMPFHLKDAQIPALQFGLDPAGEGRSGVITGMPISPGQARGTVLVIHHPSDFQKLADNLILVLPSTDPAWLALLSEAAGLIVETGGLLSHGSVIAREYGLPAVANIPQATQRFHTGDKVLVDGSTGIIQMLEVNLKQDEL